jgi:hypothetical protein
MSTVQIRALSTLVQSANAGGYTLPTDVTDTYRVWQQLAQTEIPTPRQFGAEDAVARIVAAVTAGEPFDPMALCRASLTARDEKLVHDEAQAALRIAIDQAASNAVNTASTAADDIITEHLRPAYLELVEKAREVASALRPHTDAQFLLDLQGIVAATSSKVRAAYLQLPELVERYRLIRQARDHANTIGTRKPQHDATGMFVSFEKPLAFHPSWKHPAPIPPLPAPSGATERLLWQVSDQVAIARPWFPTVREQDAAWLAQFGEAIAAQGEGRAVARAVAATAA